ncbi:MULTISPECIES: aspartate carbamoyltransferase catalytic subunit [Gemella]|uniref:aspartate carbamoyltransferase catalytic subunit n=1 Tax=Gemella TaxID=1378 RepID=UPI0007684DF1|nr:MULTISPECIES: aspartate carbamoyltransferase catalytic subunit [Gemella]AME09193.1 aspartate carbamoyltransferase [Gemella sp. oral taxon 928]AXI26826.1 aspartate carbamoyltransferase catalytic subunit [Gemella sp. ND 6198]
MKNIVSMSDLTNEEVYSLVKRALELKSGKKVAPREDLYVANLFFENSTRTKHSFEVAEHKHRLNVINFDITTSSVNKGETFYDTCKTLEMIGCNMLVIRHNKEKYYKELKSLNIPILNGGDGSGEHPSQCLLDLMTIYERFGKFSDLNIIIAGDIKNSRVARSNYNMLTRLGAKASFVCPECFKDETLGKVVDFDEIIEKVDICMLLRVQHERHSEHMSLTKEEYHKNYGLTLERYKHLKDTAIIMHPAPVNRDMEIADELVESSKSVIFEQMKNGMFMRQAMIEKIIKDNNL